MKRERATGLAGLTLVVLSGGCLAVLGIDEDYQLGTESSGAAGGIGGAAGATGAGDDGVAGSDGATSGGGAVLVCTPESVEPCYSGQDGTEGVGACRRGTRTCATDGSAWGPCEGEVFPVLEVCNGLDDDCDNSTDEDLLQDCYSGPTGTQGTGSCHSGQQICSNGVWGACQEEVVPAAEACNAVDDDCDGLIDQHSETCYTGPSGTSGRGICHAGVRTCSDGVWGACTGQQTPLSETCNNIDDDCNGQVDDELRLGPCDTGWGGPCAAGETMCHEGRLYCEPSVEPNSEDNCNGIDDDCDGSVDECFVAGTPIAMVDGTQRPIERIQVGDWVLAYDVEAAVVAPAPVLRTFVHEQQAGGNSIIRVNGALRATSNHPFYANGRWVPASKLSVSDELLVLESSSNDGLPMAQSGAVSSLYVESEREMTYNLTVGTHHNYFAGGVLVHNKRICP